MTLQNREQVPCYRWVILGILWIAYIVVFLQRLSVGPLAPFLKDELHITSAQVGIVMSAASLGYMLTLFPAGWVVDKMGVRLPIVIAELTAGICMISIYFVSSYMHLLILMLMTGLACGFLMPSTSRSVVDWFPLKERATAMGFKQTAVNVGGIISASTLPILAIALGWRYGFVSLGIIAIVVGFATLVLYKDPPKTVLSDSKSSDDLGKPVTLVELFKNREIWLVATCGLCLAWVEMAMIGHLVLYLKEVLLFSVVTAGGLLAMTEASGAIARPGGGFISDRSLRGKRKPIFIAMASTASVMCLLLGLFGPHLSWAIYLVLILLGLSGIGFGGIYFALLAELGGQHGAGRAVGLGNTVSMAGSVLGPIVFGNIVDISGSYKWAWLSLSCIATLCVFLLIPLSEEKREI